MNKLNILLVNGSSPPMRCGVGVYGYKLLLRITSLCNAALLTTGTLQDKSTDTPRRTVSNWKIRSLPKILLHIKSANPDIVHIQYPAVGYKRELGINLLPLALRLTTKRKIIVTLHEYYGSAMLGKIRNLLTILFAQKVIVSNEYDHHALPKFLRKKTVVVRIGPTITKQEPHHQTFKKLLETAHFTPTLPTVVNFGFVNPSKGIHILIQAMPFIHAQLILVCELSKDNSYHQRILDLIKTARKQGAQIFITGYLEDKQLSEILQECSIFVLPQPLPLTAKSSTAIVATEHGLPVIATAAANKLFNQPFNENNSVLLHGMSAKNLTDACNMLLSDPKKIHSIRQHNAELTKNFSWDTITQQHIKTYRSML